MPHRNVQLLSAKAFNDLVKSIKIRIRRYGIMAELYNWQIQKLQEKVDNLNERKAGKDEDNVAEATGELEKIQKLFHETKNGDESL